MVASGVKNIPTLLIDGKEAFVSIIPPVEKISEAIQKVLEKK